MTTLPLMRHPAFPCPYVHKFDVSIFSSDANVLTLQYRVEGNIEDLRLPAQASARFTDGLWKHTCLEAFVKTPATGVYHELNVSPSGEWAAYRFDRYRQGMTPVASAPAPTVVCRRQAKYLEADVEVRRSTFGGVHSAELQLGLASVIEDRHGQLSYWALAHPPGKPDFHHADGFTLILPPPAGEHR